MKFELKLEPFHHIIIHDVYDLETYNKVISELKSFADSGKLKPPNQTGSAESFDGVVGKQNSGFFFQPEDHESYIQKSFNRFMYKYHTSDAITKELQKSWFFLERMPLESSTIISYYAEEDYYLPHTDQSAITWLFWMNEEPKSFTGGDLYFPKFNYTIEYENNKAICFYSRIQHQVKTVKMKPGSRGDSDGRFCITHFMVFDKFLF